MSITKTHRQNFILPVYFSHDTTVKTSTGNVLKLMECDTSEHVGAKVIKKITQHKDTQHLEINIDYALLRGLMKSSQSRI